MTGLLQDLAPAAVIPAIEANLCALARVMGQSPMTTLHETDALLWYLTGIPHPVFNGVVRAELEPGQADGIIQETLARFRDQKLPMWWVTGPSTRPADLGARLQAHGFIQEEQPGIGAENLGMAADLHALDESLPAPSDLRIEPVQDERGHRQWAEAARQGFDLTEPVVDGWLRLNTSLPGPGPLRHFVGLRGREPVATTSLLGGGGVAGIYNVCTVPEQRRQGIGSALVLAALRAARAMGYRVGVLMAAPMGVNVYRRIGFHEQCKFGVYFWLGESVPAE